MSLKQAIPFGTDWFHDLPSFFQDVAVKFEITIRSTNDQVKKFGKNTNNVHVIYTLYTLVVVPGKQE